MLLLATGCGQGSSSSGGGHHLNVVAAENVWGSIVTQLGGPHVTVLSVVTNPNADPHEYESSSTDARAIAEADLVVVNGAGYDEWASRLVNASSSSSRTVLNIAALLGKSSGDNPHFWYSPDGVERVADRITSDLSSLDPADGHDFASLRQRFEAALDPYHTRIVAIRKAFAGAPVAATEDIVVYLAQALGLDLVSPPRFMKAVAEGNSPPADAVAQFHDLLAHRGVRVLVYNRQTVTPITTSLKQLAAQQNIPVVGVSETLQPRDATFQDWQLTQLVTLQNALNGQAAGGS